MQFCSSSPVGYAMEVSVAGIVVYGTLLLQAEVLPDSKPSPKMWSDAGGQVTLAMSTIGTEPDRVALMLTAWIRPPSGR